MSTSVYDMQTGYHPILMEKAHREGAHIVVSGRGGPKEISPRIKHRLDCRLYVCKEKDKNGKCLAWATGEFGSGLIMSPRFANPQRGEGAVFHALVDLLLDHVADADMTGIVGKLNEDPIADPRVAKQFPKEKFAWNPYQKVQWGRMVDDKFLALPAEVLGEAVTAEILLDEVEHYLGEKEWNDFVSRESHFSGPNIPLQKMLANIQTLQRVDVSSNNCYGLALSQFSFAIDSLMGKGEKVFRIAIGRDEPIKERKKKTPSVEVSESSQEHIAEQQAVPL